MGELQTDGGGKKGKKRGKKQSTRIDFTPMVDLGFLLITFFMLTTTFSKPVTMEINMPAKPEEGDPPPPEIKASKVITVMPTKDDQIVYYKGVDSDSPTVENTSFGSNGIRRILLEHKAAVKQQWNDEQEAVVIIKPDSTSTYRNMVDILDEMQICDVQRYALVGITPQEMDMIKKNRDLAEQAEGGTTPP